MESITLQYPNNLEDAIKVIDSLSNIHDRLLIENMELKKHIAKFCETYCINEFVEE